ncbi:hypothetical protein [Kutzneria chonburiensis]|uniref:Uncharacterized protein n=1 Tax=Kutzneria chonburiensis TaxID=1483604 RepID=A0ABV6MNJ4_9PSEU|nr:hypothetical protein [Kutzneria chonburiensis]
MEHTPRVAIIGDADTELPEKIPGLDIVPLTSHYDAIYLGGVDQAHARRRKAEFTDVPCLTREEMTAVGLTGRLLVLLSRTGRTPASARVVIVESTAIPTLCTLLLAAGIGDIVSWEPTDALSYPLRQITYHSDAVIDPLGGGVPVVLPSTETGQPPLIAADDPAYPLLALPGLVRALLAHPGARPEFDVLRACAFALAAHTPAHRWLPDQDDPELCDTVFTMASRAIGR